MISVVNVFLFGGVVDIGSVKINTGAGNERKMGISGDMEFSTG